MLQCLKKAKELDRSSPVFLDALERYKKRECFECRAH